MTDTAESGQKPPYSVYAIRVFVDDFMKARAFYNQILGLEELWAFSDMKSAGYNAGATIIVEESDDPSFVGRFLGVSLSTNDINARYEELASKGVEFSGPPEKQSWGGSTTHFKDIAGNVLTLLGD